MESLESLGFLGFLGSLGTRGALLPGWTEGAGRAESLGWARGRRLRGCCGRSLDAG